MLDSDARGAWRRTRIAAAVLSLNLVGIAVSLWSALFGPRWMVSFGAVGFVIGWSAFFFAVFWLRRIPVPLDAVSSGVRRWESFIERLGRVLVAAVFIGVGWLTACFLVLLLVHTVRGDAPVFRIPDLPVLRQGVPAELQDRSWTVVAAYYLSGIAFFTGWHGGAALISTAALHYLLFGRRPPCLKGFR